METTENVRELACVVLLCDVSAKGLRQGDVGTVVLVRGEGVAFAFVAESGQTVAVVTLDRAEVRPLKAAEVTLTRALTL